MDYEPGTGSRQLFPKMHLETCEGPLSSVRAMVELQTSHIGKGCDRETYSEKSLQKLCGTINFSTNHIPVSPELGLSRLGLMSLMSLIQFTNFNICYRNAQNSSLGNRDAQYYRLYHLFHIEHVTVDNEYLIVHAHFPYFYIFNDHCHQLN